MSRKSDAEALLKEVATRHAIHLEQLKSGNVQAFDRFLKRMEKDITAALAKVGDPKSLTGKRLTALLKTIEGTIKEGFEAYGKVWREQITELSVYEARFTVKALGQAVAFDYALPTAATLATAAFSKPLSVKGIDGGSLLEPFYRNWTGKTYQRVEGAIRLAAAQSESLPQVMQRIRGTKAAGFKDGLLYATKRDVATMSRTAIAHVTNQARAATYAANADIIDGEEIVAVLDSKTSAQCRALDGQVFKLGEGPRPPFHPNCRTLTVPRLKAGLAFLEGGGTQMSRGEDGLKKVDADLNYFDWLKTQSAGFQDDVIGPTRGKLLRDGGISAERFRDLQLDKNFRPRSLDELRKLEPLAFEKAGI